MITARRPRHERAKATELPLLGIKPSPENDRLYRPVDPSDSEIVALADSIRSHGVLEPLVVTGDGYIVSGHRRYAAAKLARLATVPCRVLPIRRADDLDGFVRLLREHNRQRDKTNDERLREEVISINPDDAHKALVKYRREKAAVRVQPLKLGHDQIRAEISTAKRPMLEAVKAIIEERSDFWPLSDRQIHYALLNDPPLIHASKPKSRYKNDLASYKSLVDLLTTPIHAHSSGSNWTTFSKATGETSNKANRTISRLSARKTPSRRS
jgi:hypothetical protein